MSKWIPVGVELIESPLTQEAYQMMLDEIAELLYRETCQQNQVSSSSADLGFEQNETKEVIH